MIKYWLSLVTLSLFTATAQAQFVDGIYQKISDEKTCSKTEEGESDEGPGYIEYVCNGPAEGIVLTYLTGGDWDNVTLTIGEKSYGFWEQISATGGFSGFGNTNGIVEWVGKKAAKGIIDPVALIIRFNGTQYDNSGENPKYVSQLAVYGINGDSVCFKGFAKGKNENEKARELAKKGKCIADLPTVDAE